MEMISINPNRDFFENWADSKPDAPLIMLPTLPEVGIIQAMTPVAFCSLSARTLPWSHSFRHIRRNLTSIRMRLGGGSSRVEEEHFDVIDEDGVPQGFSKPRSQVHRDGDWHRSTHIWVCSQSGRILLQLRASGKDTFPGRWDVSAAGHISAGDESLPSATRELEEELGISLKPDENLEFVASVKASATGRTERHGPYVDNEIQDIYVYWPTQTVPEESMVLQEDEVERIEYWNWQEYKERCLRGDEALVPRSPMYKDVVFPWFDREFQKRGSQS